MKEKKIRVFVVDDSAVARLGLRRLLRPDKAIEVVGEAASGEAALRRLAECDCDLVLMDVLLPGMDGLETTRRIMAERPRPILVVSALAGHDAKLGFKALQAGALELLAKPSATDLEDPEVSRRWCRRLRVLADVPVITRRRGLPTTRPHQVPSPQVPSRRASSRRTPRRVDLVAVGASTGGPPALHQILDVLEGAPAWPLVIVQHITPGFTPGLASWLADATGCRVEVVEASLRPEAGVVYLAGDHRHLEWSGGLLVPRRGPPRRGHQPSVDVFFESVARSPQADSTVAVLLTGMGDDGAEGLAALRRAGALTLAQDAASSVVYGMPKAAADLGGACEVLALEEIGQRLRELTTTAI